MAEIDTKSSEFPPQKALRIQIQHFSEEKRKKRATTKDRLISVSHQTPGDYLLAE